MSDIQPAGRHKAPHPTHRAISVTARLRYATSLRASGAWHIPPIAMLPGHTRRLTKSINARAGFSRQRHSVISAARNAKVVPGGEEPGEEDHRHDQDDQHDTGDKTCPGWKLLDHVWPLPSRRIGRIGLRGQSCRFVSGLRCWGRTFITRHAAVLPHNRERNCALMSKPAETRGAAKASVLMTSLSIWSVIRVVFVLSCGLHNLPAHTSAFPMFPTSARCD
jgi:hypothetical protein